jgi:hypothetical protein
LRFCLVGLGLDCLTAPHSAGRKLVYSYPFILFHHSPLLFFTLCWKKTFRYKIDDCYAYFGLEVLLFWQTLVHISIGLAVLYTYNVLSSDLSRVLTQFISHFQFQSCKLVSTICKMYTIYFFTDPSITSFFIAEDI